MPEGCCLIDLDGNIYADDGYLWIYPIISDAGDHAVYTALIDEFYTVAEAKGLVFEGDARQATRDRMALFPPDTTSSMQRDFATHHKTELEALVGYIVHEAEALHVEVPHYKKIYTALKRQSA